MATQLFQPAAEFTPFITLPGNQRADTILPVGMVSYQLSDALAAGVAGEVVQIDFELPPNLCYRLCGWNCSIDVNGGTNYYTQNPHWRAYWGPVEESNTREIEFPMVPSTEAGDDTRWYQFGMTGGGGNNPGGNDILSSPARFIWNQIPAGVGSLDPAFQVQSTAIVNAGGISVLAVFLAYSFQQRNHAELHVHFPPVS